MWKLIQVTNNIYDWSAKLDTIRPVIQSDSADDALIIYYLQTAEQYLKDYCNIAIIENTYKVLKECDNVAYTGVANPITPLLGNYCCGCVPFDTEFQAGQEPSLALFNDILSSVKSMYNGCECNSALAMKPLSKYINPIAGGKEDKLCCYNQA